MRSRSCRIGWALLLSLSLLPLATARAGEPPSGRRKRIAVLDVKPLGAFDPKLVAGLSPLVASEAARSTLQVISGADLDTLLGFEKQQQLLGCTETSCLAEVGGALGAQYLLSSQVSQVGEVWLLSLTLFDLSRSRVEKRLTRRAAKVGALVDVVPPAVHQLLEEVGGRPAALEARAEAPRPGRAARIAGITLDVAGVALLAGGLGCGLAARGSYDRADELRRGALPGDESAFAQAKDDARKRMIAADALYAAGAVALGVGVVLTITGLASGSTPVAVSAAPTAGGANVVLSGAF